MRAKYVLSGIFLCMIIGCMFWAVYSFAANQADKHNVREDREINIDWERLYPFEKGIKRVTKQKETLYEYVKRKCEDYSSRNFFGYYSIVEYAKQYENVVAWNMVHVSDYNAVVKLHDDYLTTYQLSEDVTENARSTIELSEYCRKNGIEFFYANFPAKICIYEDKDVSGILDFTNQNADKFLAMLNASGVKYYDFRKMLHDDGMKHHEAFYVTDHHWKAETGLWAARHILKILRDDYNWDVNPDVLNPERFDYVIYPEWFLGSQGKKVTLSQTKPDDFTMIYPKFETHIHYEIPSKEINTDGNFSVTLNMKQIEKKDYYHLSPYHAYSYGDIALIKCENYLIRNGKKILVIHDSFSDCVLPFLSTGNQNVDAIDLRHFTGSLKSYITKHKPDLIAVMYNSGIPANKTYPAIRLYDFK